LLGSGGREYFLYDSFEGLPDAKDIDGVQALSWQSNTISESYFDNCSADISYAKQAMKISGVREYRIVKGWFKETLPGFDRTKKIAFLRLDGDWYDSTMDCLINLYDYMVPGGCIVIDDYYTWEGCNKAIHDFFNGRGIYYSIRQLDNDVCYIIVK
jgi:O-methyltransferase